MNFSSRILNNKKRQKQKQNFISNYQMVTINLHSEGECCLICSYSTEKRILTSCPRIVRAANDPRSKTRSQNMTSIAIRIADNQDLSRTIRIYSAVHDSSRSITIQCIFIDNEVKIILIYRNKEVGRCLKIIDLN